MSAASLDFLWQRFWNAWAARPLKGSVKTGEAFSLIELVLALGVVAFALIGIIGLFPVAIKSAQASRHETRATLIAQQIFSDLVVEKGSCRLVVMGPSASEPSSVKRDFSLAVDGNEEFVAYDEDGVGLTGTGGEAFTNGYAPASFLARIEVDTNTGIPNLSRVQTTVETPAAAPSSNRSKFTFVTLVNY